MSTLSSTKKNTSNKTVKFRPHDSNMTHSIATPTISKPSQAK